MAKRRPSRGTRRLSPKLLEADSISVGAAEVNYEIVQEQRVNSRYSLTPRRAYLRVPFGITQAEFARQRSGFMSWLTEVVQNRPKLEAAHTPKEFRDGQTWVLGEHRLRLSFEYGDVRGASAKTGRSPLADGAWAVTIKLPQGVNDSEKAVFVEKLLYKVAASRMQARLTEEVLALNDAHFRVGISRVKLSATTSRWGSCSTSGTISLSTRLLGAPAFCRKAVIVHELAHRIEMNHSARFWKLVYDAMPDYEAADAWLKEYGAGIGWEKWER